MLTVTVSFWTTAWKPAFVSRVFPDLWSANIFGPQSFRWTKNWRPFCCTAGTANDAAGAEHGSCLALTGPNTALTVPEKFIVSRKQRVNGSVGKDEGHIWIYHKKINQLLIDSFFRSTFLTDGKTELLKRTSAPSGMWTIRASEPIANQGLSAHPQQAVV